jgi:hypothetical protein
VYLCVFACKVQSGHKTLEDKPAFTTWKDARKSDEFKDVKERAQHTHARCGVCAELKIMLLAAFANGAAQRMYEQRRRTHDEEVIMWRKLEENVKAKAVAAPGDHVVIMHDGTSAIGMPKLGHRSIKNLNPARYEVTPWLGMDYTAGTKDYIYSPTENTPKDANTLISQLHAMVRRVKANYGHPGHRARTLTIIADSASENKNNTLLAYCTDMVQNGWFDSVELLFGPVGHTHNGVDATHKVHNQDVGRQTSGDLGHFVHNYVKGFSGELGGKLRPDANILVRTVDWKTYYKPVLRRIVGFVKSKHDQATVRGFRIAKQQDSTVAVHWKADPAIDEDWRGQGGYAGTAGFYMLLGQPIGLPAYIVRKTAVTRSPCTPCTCARRKAKSCGPNR